MKQWIDRIQGMLLEREPRERVIFVGGAIVLLLTVFYLALWEPVVSLHRERIAALSSARAQSAQIERAAAMATISRGTNRSVDVNTSLVTAVDRTSRSKTLGKTPSRVQPEGDREVKVWLDDVPFANLLRWLNELESRYAIVPTEVEIERADTPGQVSGRLTLRRS